MECSDPSLPAVPKAIRSLVDVVTNLEEVFEKLSQKFESVLLPINIKTSVQEKDHCGNNIKLAQEIEDNVGRLKNLTERFNSLASRCQL